MGWMSDDFPVGTSILNLLSVQDYREGKSADYDLNAMSVD